MTSVLDTGGCLTGIPAPAASAPAAWPILRAVSRLDSSDAVITLDGEIDISSASQIRDAVTECLRMPSPRSLHIDLSAVTFCDCTGIEALEWAQGRARTGRLRFSLSGVDKRLRRVFSLAHADGLLAASRPLRVVN
jgi:anti-anti-sigma factor